MLRLFCEVAIVFPSTPWIERQYGDFGYAVNFLAALAIMLTIFVLIIFKARHINWADSWTKILPRKREMNHARHLEMINLKKKNLH